MSQRTFPVGILFYFGVGDPSSIPDKWVSGWRVDSLPAAHTILYNTVRLHLRRVECMYVEILEILDILDTVSWIVSSGREEKRSFFTFPGLEAT